MCVLLFLFSNAIIWQRIVQLQRYALLYVIYESMADLRSFILEAQNRIIYQFTKGNFSSIYRVISGKLCFRNRVVWRFSTSLYVAVFENVNLSVKKYFVCASSFLIPFDCNYLFKVYTLNINYKIIIIHNSRVNRKFC